MAIHSVAADESPNRSIAKWTFCYTTNLSLPQLLRSKNYKITSCDFVVELPASSTRTGVCTKRSAPGERSQFSLLSSFICNKTLWKESYMKGNIRYNQKCRKLIESFYHFKILHSKSKHFLNYLCWCAEPGISGLLPIHARNIFSILI